MKWAMTKQPVPTEMLIGEIEDSRTPLKINYSGCE